ncbi:MAG: hypothetical protein KDA58_07860, partial [Planctomycetaceae bacterium]|nr:hypothetical protein [Planctomycetaceae bacterium]
VSQTPKESMNDLNWIVTSIFGGCLVGLFLVGFFTTRVGNSAVNFALLISIVFNIYLGAGLAGWLPESVTLNVHSYLVGVLVNVVFATLAIGLSLASKPPEHLEGLTIWTMPKRSIENTVANQ